jgi:glutathione S-transferase
MFILYFKPTCPFCQRVLQTAENLGVEFDLKDITESDAIADELIAKGGKRQVPFLVDTEKDVSMYESSDIIDYIKENKPAKADADTPTKPRVHISNSVCESCEG